MGHPGVPSDPLSTLIGMHSGPNRIDLLELDIDLRLADLWREAGTKILPIDLLERPMALLDETRSLLEH